MGDVIKGVTDKQFDAFVEKMKKLSNKQLAVLNFEVWCEARKRGAVNTSEPEVEVDEE